MASTPFFVWAPHTSPSAAGDSDVVGSRASAEVLVVTSPEVAGTVARPRLRKQPSGPKQAAGAKKPPQRGLGVAELERLRVGRDTLRELTAVGDVHTHHFLHHHLPATTIDNTTGTRFYSPVLVQPSQPPAPAATVCYVHSPAAGGQRSASVAPEQQFAMDRWGCMGGFPPAGNVGFGMGGGQQKQHLAMAEPPSSQRSSWGAGHRQTPSPCLHSDHHCDFCVRKRRMFGERHGATAAVVPDYSVVDLAAAMATTHQEEKDGILMWEGKREREREEEKEVREIEFFPPSTRHGGYTGESEFAGATSFSYSSPSSSSGGSTMPLDLSLKL